MVPLEKLPFQFLGSLLLKFFLEILVTPKNENTSAKQPLIKKNSTSGVKTTPQHYK